MNIYLDYDDLLVHNDTPRGGGMSSDAKLVNDGTHNYVCRRRPSADQILKILGEYGDIIILSSGTRNYVSMTSKALGFNFKKILGFEDFMEEIPQGWGQTQRRRHTDNFDPAGVLVDHTLPFQDVLKPKEILEDKMKFLGISKERLILIEPYQIGRASCRERV